MKKMVRFDYDGRVYHTLDGRSFYLQPPKREELPDKPGQPMGRVKWSWVEVKHPRILKKLRKEVQNNPALRRAFKDNVEERLWTRFMKKFR